MTWEELSTQNCEEKDLGVTMNVNMKASEQCRIAASNGNQVILYTGMESIYQERHRYT